MPVVFFSIKKKKGVHHLTIINTSQEYIQKYADLKRKPYNCNANVHFNKKKPSKQLTPQKVVLDCQITYTQGIHKRMVRKTGCYPN